MKKLWKLGLLVPVVALVAFSSVGFAADAPSEESAELNTELNQELNQDESDRADVGRTARRSGSARTTAADDATGAAEAGDDNRTQMAVDDSRSTADRRGRSSGRSRTTFTEGDSGYRWWWHDDEGGDEGGDDEDDEDGNMSPSHPY